MGSWGVGQRGRRGAGRGARGSDVTSRELGMYWGKAWENLKKEWKSVKGRPNHHRKHARMAWISWLEPLKGTRKRI